jgi:hypothetical protein
MMDVWLAHVLSWRTKPVYRCVKSGQDRFSSKAKKRGDYWKVGKRLNIGNGISVQRGRKLFTSKLAPTGITAVGGSCRCELARESAGVKRNPEKRLGIFFDFLKL